MSNYLEIGVQNGINLANISVKAVTAVDPHFEISVDITRGKEETHLYRITSDEYFRLYAPVVANSRSFDFSFLDGMHLFEYLLRDFYNVEMNSTEEGLISMHDCMPFDGDMIRRNYLAPNPNPGPYQTFWTGDVWKIVPIIQKFRPDLRVALIDCSPTGLVVISKLNPRNTILKDKYYEIVEEFYSMTNDEEALIAFYGKQKVLQSSDILKYHDHTLYFNI